MHVVFFYCALAAYFFASFMYVNIPVIRSYRIKETARRALTAAVIFNLSTVLFRWSDLNYPPLSNPREAFIIVSLFVSGACLIFDGLAARGNGIGGYAAFFGLLSFGYASLDGMWTLPSARSAMNGWQVMHSVSSSLAYIACFVAFVCSVFYLVREGKADPRTLKKADTLAYCSVMTALPLLTGGLSSGIVWANTSLGRYWVFGPAESLGFAAWLIYTSYMHVRRYGKSGQARVSAILAVIGFVCAVLAMAGGFFQTRF